MAYTPTTWQTGDKITSQKMNKLEQGVADAQGGAVASVNGQTGAVVLDAEDVGALPDSTTIPTQLSQLTGDSTHRTVTDSEKSTWTAKGSYSKPSSGIPKADLASAVQTSLGKADSAQPLLVSGTNIKTVNGNSLLGSGNIEISGGGGGAVNSVNGKTGTVVLNASDVGALPDTTTIPTQLSQLTADSNHRTVTDSEKSTWNGKQAAISDLNTIRSGAAAGATAVQPGALATVATSGSYNDLSNKPSIPTAVTESTVSGWGFTKNTGTYSKPSTGIPKSDLASAVQTSLGKADSAIQNIKTVNGQSLVGTGGITIPTGVEMVTITSTTANPYTTAKNALDAGKLVQFVDDDGYEFVYDLCERYDASSTSASYIMFVQSYSDNKVYYATIYGNESVTYGETIIADKITSASGTNITLHNGETVTVSGTPTALNVSFEAPVSGTEYMTGLIFKAGNGFAFHDTAPSGYTIEWADEPTWTAGHIYEIIYRCLWTDNVIAAKWAEVTA